MRLFKAIWRALVRWASNVTRRDELEAIERKKKLAAYLRLRGLIR